MTGFSLPPAPVLWTLACAGVALAVGSVIRLVRRRTLSEQQREERLRSLATWWVLYLLLSIVVLGGQRAIVILLGVLSLIGLWEYGRLVQGIMDARWLVPSLWVIAASHYATLFVGQLDLARGGTPPLAMAVLFLLTILRGRTAGFLRSTAVPLTGLLLIAYGPSHAAMLVPDTSEPAVAVDTGPFLCLILLTELHDIAQALWGRTVGKRKLTPKISPGKTWEGLLLGSATTVCLASVLVPLLAPLPGSGDETGYGLWAAMLAYGAGAGLSIAVAGLVGDLAVSGIKRDAGVKDSGRILPGQGGILDRIDSLTLSAPAFYYYTLAAAYAAT